MATHTEKKERSGREVLDALELSVTEIAAQLKVPKNGDSAPALRKRESDDTRELYKALHAAQRAFKDVAKSGFIGGRNIPYAKINDLVDASRTALHAHNLVVSTYQIAQPGLVTLITRLYHITSGQFIESELPLLNSSDEQKRGSSITYAWRYTYAPLIGLVDSSCDDDGEATKR